FSYRRPKEQKGVVAGVVCSGCFIRFLCLLLLLIVAAAVTRNGCGNHRERLRQLWADLLF
ncbi:MAG: hypothetical protein LUD46_22370, partial [Parabacteroides sp.]|nr:hypothetical protein [Parabacteroides sp.]